MNWKNYVKKEDLERGQAFVLLALAFVGIAAFIGLTVDAGILFSNVGHLRRATDSASLAAANQFREGRTPTELSNMAFEFLELNGLSPSGVVAKVCDLGSPGSSYDDPNLCPGGTNPPSGPEALRKYVRVEASLPINFAFLPIVGWRTTTIQAESISEAASLDLVLVIDNSTSMAFDLCQDGDDDDGDGTDDDCPGFPTPQDGPTSDADTALCNATNTCQPFEDVRSAALALAARMYFPYDRMAVVTYARTGTTEINLADGTNLANVQAAINGLQVTGPPPDPPCSPPPPPPALPDPRGCTGTNTEEGLMRAGNLFADPNEDSILTPGEVRAEAVWIVILLSDGATNAARTTSSADPSLRTSWLCPQTSAPFTGAPSWVQPFCRDHKFEIGDGEWGTDAEDRAEGAALFVGCPDASMVQPPECAPAAPGGQRAVIFTIGLGDLMINNQVCDAEYASYDPPGCEEDSAEGLLRYIAAIGDDGEPGSPDPCNGVPKGQSCGNYYFSPSGTELLEVFEAIASRIFTRITH